MTLPGKVIYKFGDSISIFQTSPSFLSFKPFPPVKSRSTFELCLPCKHGCRESVNTLGQILAIQRRCNNHASCLMDQTNLLCEKTMGLKVYLPVKLEENTTCKSANNGNHSIRESAPLLRDTIVPHSGLGAEFKI